MTPRTVPRFTLSRRGFTLVELTVVLLIAVLLMAIAIPAVRTGIEQRGRREAARQVNTLLTSARAEATGTGRSRGIWIERDRQDPTVGFQLYVAEVPPPYTGEMVNSCAYITRTSTAVAANRTVRAWFGVPDGASPASIVGDVGIRQLVSPGDRIQFGGRGPIYRIASVGFDTTVQLPFADIQTAVYTNLTSGARRDTLPPPGGFTNIVATDRVTLRAQAPGVPYSIDRSASRASTPALEMPSDTVIDLSLSGVGVRGMQFVQLTNTTPPAVVRDPVTNGAVARGGPIVIMFSPQGLVEEIYLGNARQPITGPVYLHIGRRDQTALLGNVGGPYNKTDGSNFWVMINNTNGAVVTAENVILDPTGMVTLDATDPIATNAEVAVLRTLARDQRVVGGE